MLNIMLSRPFEDSIELTFFLISFGALLSSFVTISTRFIGVFSYLLQFATVVFGMTVTLAILQLTEEQMNWTVQYDSLDSATQITYGVIKLCAVAFILFLISELVLSSFNTKMFVVPEDDIFSPIIQTFALGIYFVGLVYLIIAIVVALRKFGDRIFQNGADDFSSDDS